MHLPTPQFSRLVTVLAFDLSNPSLDSMILAWDHIAARYLNRLSSDPASAGRIESIRLLAIHDSVVSILGRGNSFIFSESSTGTSVAAALAAAAQASHDILASTFDSPTDLSDLGNSLEESLSFISDKREKAVGAATGAASAAAFVRTFELLSLNHRLNPAGGTRLTDPRNSAQITSGVTGWRRSA
ncbi:MAG: hypothetical protein V4819_25390 [Verrucomicrobiota bacterium]